MKPGDLVQPCWKDDYEWDYFDLISEGYAMWQKGEIGVILSVKNKRKKRESTCEILHPSGILISYKIEMSVIAVEQEP